MFLDVGLRSFAGMVRSMGEMAVSQVGMVTRGFVPASLMMLGGFAVMSCCMFVMFRGFVMMFHCSFRHE